MFLSSICEDEIHRDADNNHMILVLPKYPLPLHYL